jgi:hypothetical protein
MKIGAAYHRMGKAEEAARFFDRALKAFDARVAKGADDLTRAIHRPPAGTAG